MKRVVLTGVLVALIALVACSEKRTGPEITLYSDIYKVGDQWHCPLCNQPVKNGDRSDIDPNLYLSEWHDEFLDPDTFDQKINHITDNDLIASLAHSDRNSSGIEFPEGTDTEAALAIVLDYFSRRPDNQRLYFYDGEVAEPFITAETFVDAVQSDPERKEQIIQDARETAHPDSGYKIGNVRFGWEIDFMHPWEGTSDYAVNGLHGIIDLLNAYMVTGDRFYLESFEDIFNQWYDQKDTIEHQWGPQDKKVYGVIWYELGLDGRLPRLIDSFRIYGGQLEPRTRVRLLKMMLGSARWLHECITRTPFHPYNWQTHTAATLTYMGFAFPEFNRAADWVSVSKANMEKHFTHDILDDGGYVERSGGYTHYAFGMFYRYMLMHKHFAGDTSLLVRYLPRVENLMEFTSLTLSPIGVNCPFNDSRRSLRLAKLMVDMGEFFQRGDFIGPVSHLFTASTADTDPEDGTPSEYGLPAQRLASLSVRPRMPEVTSINFPDSKYAVMRERWDPESYFMMINYGPFANHAHHDILDFEAFANGIPLAVDAGIGTIGYSDPIHVSWYKQSRAHNMLMINEANTMKRGISGEDVIWAPQSHTDYFAATHAGYERYHDTRCRRHFVFVKGEYWLIADEVYTPHSGHQLDWHFHTPLHMRSVDNGFASLESPGALLILPEGDASERIQRTGPAHLGGIRGEPDSREVDWLTLRKTAAADSVQDRFAVLLYPTRRGETPVTSGEDSIASVRLNLLPTPTPAVQGFEITGDRYRDVIYLSDGTARELSEGLRGDFVYGWFRFRGEQLVRFSVSEASLVQWKDQVSLSFARPQNVEQEL